MQQLHPKAVWLFFLQHAVIGLPLLALVVISASFVYNAFYDALLIIAEKPTFKLHWVWFIPAFIIYPLIIYVWARLTYHFWRYQLTDGAIKIEKGIIWKKYISVPYERIQNVDIYRGILARLLGLSDLQIQTAGYSGSRLGQSTEGRLPGLGIQIAEDLREDLIHKVKGAKQGL